MSTRTSRLFWAVLLLSAVIAAAWFAVQQFQGEGAPRVQQLPNSRLNFEMVPIPAGRFQMGCVSGIGCEDNEKPVHPVDIKPFLLAKHEVTFELWDLCVIERGCTHKPDDKSWGRGTRPVINVSWNNVQDFLSWLNKKTGRQYRLPSEAEWEYASRAGSSAAFAVGACLDTDGANFNGRVEWPAGGCPTTERYLGKSMPVGSYSANAFGLHDMHGNVWEWVEDCWHKNYQQAPPDGSAWIVDGNCVSRVLRGGSWYFGSWSLRSANRFKELRGERDANFGFRLAHDL